MIRYELLGCKMKKIIMQFLLFLTGILLSNCNPMGSTVGEQTVSPGATQQETSLPAIAYPTPTRLVTPIPPAIIDQLPVGVSDWNIMKYLSPDEKWYILPNGNTDLLFTSFIAIESIEEGAVLQNTPDDEMGKGYYQYIWSPDSTTIMAVGPGGETREHNQLTIFTIKEDQINQTMIEMNMASIPRWSPDGQKIAVFDESGRLYILNQKGAVINFRDILIMKDRKIIDLIWVGNNIYYFLGERRTNNDEDLPTILYKVDTDLAGYPKIIFISEKDYKISRFMGWNEERNSILIVARKLVGNEHVDDCTFYTINMITSLEKAVMDTECSYLIYAYSDPQHRYVAIDGMHMDDQQWIFDWATEQFHPYGDIYILRWLISEEGFLYSKYFDSDNESMGRYYDIIQP